jgi:hypothetical protein
MIENLQANWTEAGLGKLAAWPMAIQDLSGCIALHPSPFR